MSVWHRISHIYRTWDTEATGAVHFAVAISITSELPFIKLELSTHHPSACCFHQLDSSSLYKFLIRPYVIFDGVFVPSCNLFGYVALVNYLVHQFFTIRLMQTACRGSLCSWYGFFSTEVSLN